jgi:hypothetical protein
MYTFQKVTATKNLSLLSFRDSLVEIIKDCGLENELRNDIYYWIKERNYFRTGARCWTEKEPLEYLREAQVRENVEVYQVFII